MFFYLTLLLCFLGTVLLTPFIKKLAFKVGATDKPSHRKVHAKIMPRMGGLAIFISFVIGVFLLGLNNIHTIPILTGSFIIVLTGIIDDIFDISAKVKLFGQIVAALVVVFWGGLHIEFINLPFGGKLEFGMLSIPITLLWIVGITNAINLIDGLDGLAAGVSSIAFITILGMAIIKGDLYVATLSAVILASTIGFLIYNFHPAKIFMGDTGSLFLGYIISVISLLGFKNITFISLIIPILILGVPISDTFFAIIRRLVNKKPLSAPDKSHLHHCLLRVGFSHRQTVILIYAIAALFGLAAFIFSMSTMWGSLILITVILLALEIFVESIGLIDDDYQPLLRFLKTRRIAIRNR